MDIGLHDLKQDLNDFQLVLGKLTNCVSKASFLWKDEKYNNLSASMRTIANISKGVIDTGNKSLTSLNRFSNIADEEI